MDTHATVWFCKTDNCAVVADGEPTCSHCNKPMSNTGWINEVAKDD